LFWHHLEVDDSWFKEFALDVLQAWVYGYRSNQYGGDGTDDSEYGPLPFCAVFHGAAAPSKVEPNP
jgi:hypothetical protein